MENEIEFLMVIKNIEWKKDLFGEVIISASKLSKNFLIVNNNSDDKTKEIIYDLAKKYNLTLNYFEDKRKDFDYLKYVYVKKITSKYVFSLDDDEVITINLLKEIKNLILNKKYELISIKWVTYFLKKEVSSSYKPILFLKKNNIFSGKKELHNLFNEEKINNIKQKYKTKNVLKHYSFLTVDDFLKKSIFYSKKEANELFLKNPNISNYKLCYLLIKESLFYFFYYLIKQKSYKSLESFLYSLNSISRVRDRILYYIKLKNGKN